MDTTEPSAPAGATPRRAKYERMEETVFELMDQIQEARKKLRTLRNKPW